MIRLFQVLALLAIANPFCCCTAGLLDRAPKALAEGSSCCGLTSNTEDAPAKPAHDTENCPHQASKEFQLAHSVKQDVKHALFEIGQLPELNYLHDVYAVVPSPGIVEWTNAGAKRIAAPPKITSVYCVYRI